jgi:hypothetical protein
MASKKLPWSWTREVKREDNFNHKPNREFKTAKQLLLEKPRRIVITSLHKTYDNFLQNNLY